VDPQERREVLRQLVDRTDLNEFADRMLDSYWSRPERQGTRGPRRRAHMWARWNVDLVLRWLVDGTPPSEIELDVLRNRARRGAEAGTPIDFVPGNFRRGARFAWNAALEVASPKEREALLDSADLLFEFVDRVSRIYAEAHESAQRHAPVPVQERLARGLLGCLSNDEPPLAEGVELATQIGFKLEGVFRPFVIVLASPPGQQHLALAEALRRRGLLAASEGQWTLGLANHRVAAHELDLPGETTIAEGGLTGRHEVGRALEELRMVVSIARSHGQSGRVTTRQYLPELLLRSGPSIAAKIREAVYGPLRAHPELSQTLDVLIRHNFNRQSAAAALPVHRNTLRERVTRISDLTGLDFDQADDRGLAWLAHLHAPDRRSPEPEWLAARAP
jgi:hypothetical protein